jgi:hypothetical protein
VADIEDDLKKVLFIRGSLGLDHRDKDLESAIVRGVNAIVTEPNKEVQQ